ncbi:VOC family protein [Glaciecola sp. 1036]|uniref:VOC family protein n=1 Tax=Alteromonadaceae TaxID=72275 RepID=UPI003D01DA10
MKNPVGWFEIYVDDMDRASEFYKSVFNVSFEPLADPTNENFKMMMFPSCMDTYGASGALVEVGDVKAGGNSTIVYFSCDDCAVEESRIEAAGGKVERSKMSIGEHGFIVLAFDTEGNMIGLHSMQ